MNADVRSCPKCGATTIVPIVYGLPATETLDLADQGWIHLGGCVVFEQNPIWHCQECEHEWGNVDGFAGPPEHSAAIEGAFKKLKSVSEDERITKFGEKTVSQFLATVSLQALADGATAIMLAEKSGCYRLLFLIDGLQTMMEPAGFEELWARFFRQKADSAKTDHVFYDAEVADTLHSFPIHVGDIEDKPSATIDLSGIPRRLGQEVARRPRLHLCPYCSEPLRTPTAKQCFWCSMDWHDPDNAVRLSPLCRYCGQLLRSPLAGQCSSCGMDWHNPDNVIQHGNPPTNISVK